MSQLTPVSNLEQGGCHRLREGEGRYGPGAILNGKTPVTVLHYSHDLGQHQWQVMSSENLVEPCPQGETGVRGLPEAQLACGDNTPPERQSQRGTQEEEVGDSGSLADNNKIQEVTSEPSEGVGQLQEDPQTGLRGNQGTSAARRSGEDGGPGVCGEWWYSGGSIQVFFSSGSKNRICLLKFSDNK